ncbi:MAG: 4-hydroxybenzoate octaprenyltransferase [Pseudomonadales bacterium]
MDPAPRSKLNIYWRLMRADRPIGTWLLLWPTMMALWVAAGGFPSVKNLLIFGCGTFLMRSAGCVINDYFDRHWDGAVERTTARPLATGEASPEEALGLFAALVTLAFLLVLQTNQPTIMLSFGALAVACCYPLMKRITQLPQLVLGVAFSFGIPMAFTAEAQNLPTLAWVLFCANVLWTTAYDTYYAMVDRKDDLKVGIKSTAVLLGRYDRFAIAVLQASTLLLLVVFAQLAQLHWPFYLGLLLSIVLFARQYQITEDRKPEKCFQAFLNNHWIGACWFAGLAIDLALF